VLIDNRAGAHAAVNHLIECGHTDIGFIGGDLSHPSIAERYAGYKEALREHGITPNERLCSIDEPDTRMMDGANAIGKILERNGRPTAVFAANDAMAIGCLRYVRNRGLTVPQDLAIVGFDDVDMSSHLEPQLTTVKVLKEEMGKLAVLRLVEMIRTKGRSVVTTHVPVELIIRESTGRVGSGTEEIAPTMSDSVVPL
jgi:LacI family transcriptional regulator